LVTVSGIDNVVKQRLQWAQGQGRDFETMKSARLPRGFQSLLALALCLASGAPATAQDGSLDGYRLVWNDEFNIDGLPDPARWAYDTSRNREGWYNRELQYYSARRPENARVEGGVLRIIARRETFTGPEDTRQYTSARLRTKNRGDWTYGRFEIRARLPKTQGLWPAIWMLPTDNVYGGWAGSGEIDIMELVGHKPAEVFGTLHHGGPSPRN